MKPEMKLHSLVVDNPFKSIELLTFEEKSMQRNTMFPAILMIACIRAALFLAGCDGSPTDSGEEKMLLGAWEFSEALSSGGFYTHELVFIADDFVSRTTSYGVYLGSSPQSVSAWSQTDGKYRVEGNKLFFMPLSLTTWDSFYLNPGPFVQRPYPYGSIFDNCTFIVQGDSLTLTYFSYPADGPVLTERTFKRQ